MMKQSKFDLFHWSVRLFVEDTTTFAVHLSFYRTAVSGMLAVGFSIVMSFF